MDENDFMKKVNFLGTMITVRASITIWGNTIEQFGLIYPEDVNVTEEDIIKHRDYYKEKMQVIEENRTLICGLIEKETGEAVDENQIKLCELMFDHNTRKGCTEIGVQYGDFYEDEEEGKKYYLVAHILIDENNEMKCTGIAG